jgi:hypothetical protein
MNTSLFLDPEALHNFDLVCGICLHAIEDPTTILPTQFSGAPCQHSFCENCLTTWRKTSRHCPICQAVIHSTFPDIKVKRLLAMQMVRCPKHVLGCQEVGKFGMGKEMFFNLHADTCGFLEIQCECTAVYLRKDRVEHYKTCPVHMIVECPFKEFGCVGEVEQGQLVEHLKSSDRQHLLLMVQNTKVGHFIFVHPV